MVVEDSVDTSNDSLLNIENGSPKKKLFPIFTNQIPSPNHIW